MSDKIIHKIVRPDILRDVTDWQFFPKERQLLKPVKKLYKISTVTTCMGRAEDIKQTFLQNIEDNKDYPHAEFVLLNYSSKDDLDEWARKELPLYIELGLVNYYKTIEDYEYFRLSHSKNIAFKIAQGDIINNVDADHYTNKGFLERINLIANQVDTTKIIFMKTRQKNRGRIGMYKHEFIQSVRGYDENIIDYGYEDPDLLNRATKLGFMCWRYSGKFFKLIENHDRHPIANYKNKAWKYTQRRNTLISILNVVGGYYQANRKYPFGKAKLLKNFTERVET